MPPLWRTKTPTSQGFVAAGGGVRRSLAEGPAEVLVHHGADVPPEVGEEDAARAQVLGARRQLLVLLLDRHGPQGAKPATVLLGGLHFGVQGQFLEQKIIILHFQKEKVLRDILEADLDPEPVL